MPAVTQIALTSNAYGDGRVVEVLVVLLEDGTMWRYPLTGADPENRVWIQVPPVGATIAFGAKE